MSRTRSFSRFFLASCESTVLFFLFLDFILEGGENFAEGSEEAAEKVTEARLRRLGRDQKDSRGCGSALWDT